MIGITKSCLLSGHLALLLALHAGPMCLPARGAEKTPETFTIRNARYELQVNSRTGAIRSLKKNGRELLSSGNERSPLFRIRFRDSKGLPLEYSASDAREFKLVTEGDDAVSLVYRSLKGLPVHATVRVRYPASEALTYWSIKIEHDTPDYIEYIDFPHIAVPNDLPAQGGQSHIFWPAMEGAVIDDVDAREPTWLKYTPNEFPYTGWRGSYPAATQMQFMAYYNDRGGLYLAAHDRQSHPKAIEYRREQAGGVSLEYIVYPGAVKRGIYSLPYEMVLGVFEGDWHDAADIYRSWVTTSGLPLPPKLAENRAIPGWFKESPVIITYPVRGNRDMGDMTPNLYYPYTSALPYLESLSKQFDSKVMALLMHWEGTAPWAPPIVWPPFGGEANFTEFVNRLHQGGNLAGVYASGLAWTMKSNTAPYSGAEEYERKGLRRIMTVAPDGDVHWSNVCSGPNAQRWSYDMCPANSEVGEIAAREVRSILGAGCDYIQYFDQNLGGASNFCYSRDHGHPEAPGPWMSEAMRGVHRKLMQEVERSGRPALIGCEAAASEPYMANLLFNDARFNINFMAGRPVPAYAYVYHEYTNNFMGNQNSVFMTIDVERSPWNLHQRLAYAFTAGDMLTVVLGDKGKMIWDWGTPWNAPLPDQDSLAILVKNMNGWRKGEGAPFLMTGRMLKPYAVAGTTDVPLRFRNGGRELAMPSLFTSRWASQDGRDAQFLVNYMGRAQEGILILRGSRNRQAVIRGAGDGKGMVLPISSGRLKVSIPPFSAVMVEFVKP